MRMRTVVLVLLAGIATDLRGSLAAEPAASEPAAASALVPVKAFTDKDLPEPEPGKPAWAAGNQWSYGVAIYDKWVYAASNAEYLLQFKTDPATAGLTYQGATSFHHHDPEKGVGVTLSIRRPADGSAMLYLRAGSHGPPLFQWYAIDKQTGKLTLKGKQLPVKLGLGVLTPDQSRCYQMAGDATLVWCRFEEDGTPVEEGRTAAHARNRYGPMVLSPDGRNLYMMDGAGRVDAYACDPRSGKPTYISTLDLQPTLQMDSGLLPLSPDGRHLYVFNGGWAEKQTPDRFCVLGRDPEEGALTMLAGGKAAAAFTGLGGPPWSRGGRFAFAADGKSGCFLTLQGYYHRPAVLGTFRRSPASGALTITAHVSARALGAACFAFDGDNGNLFTVGPRISSFKVRSGVKAAGPGEGG